MNTAITIMATARKLKVTTLGEIAKLRFPLNK